MWTDNLRQFHFWCQKTLPLVYDDSLSYYEVLAKVTKHLNELTTLVNEIGDELERYEGVTDDRLDTLETWRTEVDTWRAQIDEWKTIVENWREDVDQWREDIDQWKTSINNWKAAVDLELENLDSRLDTAESDIDSLEGRMDTAEDDIDSLEGRMNTAEDDIDTLQSDVTSLDGRLDDAETAITELDGRLDTAEDDIDTLQSDVTSLDGRLDTAEDDIDNLESSMSTAEGDIDDIQDDVTDLQNRMSTSEQKTLALEKTLRIIPISVSYNTTLQRFTGFFSNQGDDKFVKNNLTAAKICGSTFGYKIRFLMRLSNSDLYNNDNIYLYDDYSNAIQYEGVDAYINIDNSSDGVLLNNINGRSLYLIDTVWANGLRYALPGVNSGELPRPTNPSTDNGKVVAYNNTLKNYELITPSGDSSHTYSTTEQEVGTWTTGVTVYEKVISGRAYSGDITCNIGVTPTNVIQCVARARIESTSEPWYFNQRVIWNIGTNNVVVTAPVSSSWCEAEVIIRYTKT